MQLPYRLLAKACLWLVSIVLAGVFFGATYAAVCGDPSRINHVISSAQALSFIAVGVLARHMADDKFQHWLQRRAPRMAMMAQNIGDINVRSVDDPDGRSNVAT